MFLATLPFSFVGFLTLVNFSVGVFGLAVLEFVFAVVLADELVFAAAVLGFPLLFETEVVQPFNPKIANVKNAPVVKIFPFIFFLLIVFFALIRICR